MKDIDLVKLKGLAKAALNDEWIDVYELAGLSLALIEQLEAVQREIGKLEDERDGLSAALDNETTIAKKAEAELKRRDDTAVKCQAVAKHYTGCEHPVVKMTGLEFSVAGDREDAEQVAAAISELYISAPPVVLPPEMTFEQAVAECRANHVGVNAKHYQLGANAMREQVKELGCQPEKVVKLPESWAEGVASGQVLVMDEDEVKQALEDAGVKWEES